MFNISDIDRWPLIIVHNYRTGSTVLGESIATKQGFPFFSELLEEWPNNATVEKMLPFYNDLKELFLMDYYKKGSNYVLKFPADKVGNFEEYNNLLLDDRSFKIRVYRRNKIDQIVSFYIAESLQIWHQGSRKSIPSSIFTRLRPGRKKDQNALKWFRLLEENKKIIEQSDVKIDLESIDRAIYAIGYNDTILNLLPMDRDNWDQKWKEQYPKIYNMDPINFDKTLYYEDLIEMDLSNRSGITKNSLPKNTEIIRDLIIERVKMIWPGLA